MVIKKIATQSCYRFGHTVHPSAGFSLNPHLNYRDARHPGCLLKSGMCPGEVNKAGFICRNVPYHLVIIQPFS